MYECFICRYVCEPCVYLVPSEVRRASDLLDLELEKAGSYHLGPGNQIWVVYKSNKCYQLLSHPSSPIPSLFTHLISKCWASVTGLSPQPSSVLLLWSSCFPAYFQVVATNHDPYQYTPPSLFRSRHLNALDLRLQILME